MLKLKKVVSLVLLVTTFCYILSMNVLADISVFLDKGAIGDNSKSNDITEIDDITDYLGEYDFEIIDVDQVESDFESIEINLPSDEYVSDECISNEFVKKESISDENIGYKLINGDSLEQTSLGDMRLMVSLTPPNGVCTGGSATGTNLIGDMSKLDGVAFDVTRGINASKYYFKANIQKSFILPGMSSTNVKGHGCYGMVPQGLTYYNGMFFMTAYCGCDYGHNSVIYVVDSSTGNYITTLVMQEKIHAGGITYANGYLWITGEEEKNNIYYYNFSEINYAITYARQYSNVKSIDLTSYTHGKQVVNGLTTVDYCTTYSGYLCIGNFDKDKAGALKLYNPAVTASKTMNPVMEITSLPAQAQGAVIQQIGNYIYILISASWGRGNNSKVYIYRTETNNLNGSISVKKTMEMPCMLEEVVVQGNYTYMLFESCGEKYRTGSDGKGKAKCVIGNICGFANSFIFK